MESSKKIRDYLKTICEQIRWKKAHDIISEELENHIIDQKDAFISEGLDEKRAIDKAILEMGDPVLIGSELDRKHRAKPEWRIIFLTGLLLVLGFLIRGFITPIMIGDIVLTIFGIVAMILAYFMDYTVIGRYPRVIYFSLVAVVIGVMIKGGPYYASFITKFLMLLFPVIFGGIIYSMKDRGYKGILYSGIYFVFPALICMIIPSTPVLVMYSITCLTILTYAILKGWFNVKKLSAMLLIYVPAVITSFISPKFMNTYQISRLKNVLDPSLDPLGSGYMVNNTRNIISNAQFIGHNRYGIDTEGLLPNINTDFLLTHLIDRVGWISFILIMLLLATFIVISFKGIIKQKNILGGLIATSIIITFAMQVLVYAFNNLGFQLIAPLTLPLISYGRTATIINMFLIGIMLSVFRYSSLYGSRESIKQVKKKRIHFVDGKIIINLNR